MRRSNAPKVKQKHFSELSSHFWIREGKPFRVCSGEILPGQTTHQSGISYGLRLVPEGVA